MQEKDYDVHISNINKRLEEVECEVRSLQTKVNSVEKNDAVKDAKIEIILQMITDIKTSIGQSNTEIKASIKEMSTKIDEKTAGPSKFLLAVATGVSISILAALIIAGLKFIN